MMIIDIIGGGSLGLLYGGNLAASGSRVRFWCRSREQVAEMKDLGISIQEADHSAAYAAPDRFQADTVDRFAAVWEQEPSEWALLMTKQKDAEAVCIQTAGNIALDKLPEGSYPGLICFQNGFGHIERLQNLLPLWKVYAAATTEGAKRTSYHEVFHAGVGSTWIGDLNGDGHVSLDNSLSKFVAELQKAGFSSVLSNDISDRIYRKLLMNAVINPLTALWRITNGELLKSPVRVRLMKDLFNEGTAVFDACGIPWEAELWNQIVEVCISTSGNTSSMLKDVLEGVTTEIGWINGGIVTLAKKAGIQAPTHELVIRLIEGLSVEEV